MLAQGRAVSHGCSYQVELRLCHSKTKKDVVRLRHCIKASSTQEAPGTVTSSHASLAEKAETLRTWVEKFCAPWPSELQPMLINDNGWVCCACCPVVRQHYWG